MMVLEEKSQKSFLEEEPDLYSVKDFKVCYGKWAFLFFTVAGSFSVWHVQWHVGAMVLGPIFL